MGSNTFRSLFLNGGTLESVGGDWDPGTGNIQLVIGSAGGTIRAVLQSQVSINDGPAQLTGSGDLTFTGGGRYNLTGGTPSFPNFGGKVTVNGGILSVGNNNNTTTNVLGGRPEQTITLKPGSGIINNVGFGLGANGLPNNIVAEGNNEFYALAGSRVYSGDIKLNGTNTIALLERDNPVSERQIYFNGRVFGSNITLDVFGVNNGNPFYLTSGSNEITGTINLNANAVLEACFPVRSASIPAM